MIDPLPRKKAGRKSYFSPKGKVALMILKSYTVLSATKLMEQLNANILYQIFCGIPDRCQAAVGMYRNGVSDDVRGKP